ncbi:hypothetical protein PR001_g32246 [Phytophthora rubi]|uniref:Secreted protein n=1 Tax=Phytophthora rubi TaxID=129364 RepID=A0A6A3GC17_9STRA|nr:hypothetical protein PR001_g33763 [Phytophthora rubi]KAE8955069.1 hypothetical protein PR001_g32246 [Phytophthora rubi]
MTILLFILQRCHASFARYEAPGALPTPLTTAHARPRTPSPFAAAVTRVQSGSCWVADAGRTEAADTFPDSDSGSHW